MEDSNAPQVEPPLLTEQELIAAYTSGRAGLRDVREIATVIARYDKPVLIVDERRVGRPTPFVLFSIVSLQGRAALEALQALNAARDAHPRLTNPRRKMSGPRLLRETSTDAISYRREIESWLDRAQVLRIGVRTDLLVRWRRERRFDVVTQPSHIRLKESEFDLLRNAMRSVAQRLALTGLQFVVLDRSMQNGMSPSQHRLKRDELGIVCYREPSTGCAVTILGSTPEEPQSGGWLALPDYDLARAVLDPRFDEFAQLVRYAPTDQFMEWSYGFPLHPSQVA